MGDISEYVTTRVAAEMLKVSKSSVDQFVRSGKLSGTMVGAVRLLLRSEVEAFALIPRDGPGPKPKGKPAPVVKPRGK